MWFLPQINQNDTKNVITRGSKTRFSLSSLSFLLFYIPWRRATYQAASEDERRSYTSNGRRTNMAKSTQPPKKTRLIMILVFFKCKKFLSSLLSLFSGVFLPPPSPLSLFLPLRGSPTLPNICPRSQRLNRVGLFYKKDHRPNPNLQPCKFTSTPH